MIRATEIEAALRRMFGEWHTRTANASDDADLPVGELAMALRKLADHVEDARPSEDTEVDAKEILDAICRSPGQWRGEMAPARGPSPQEILSGALATRDLYRLRDDHAQEPLLVAMANQGATKDETIDRLLAARRADRALHEDLLNSTFKPTVRLPVLQPREEKR